MAQQVAQVIKLGVDSDDLIFQQFDGNEVIRIGDDRALYFFDKGGEYIIRRNRFNNQLWC